MKNSVFLTTIFLLLSCSVVYGQLSTLEEPVSFRTDVPALRISERTQKTLPSFDRNKVEREDRDDEAKGIPPRFGYKHAVQYNLENSGEWTVLPDGGKIWRLTIACQGALSINLLYDKFWIPDGARFWLYSNDRQHSKGVNDKPEMQQIIIER